MAEVRVHCVLAMTNPARTIHFIADLDTNSRASTTVDLTIGVSDDGQTTERAVDTTRASFEFRGAGHRTQAARFRDALEGGGFVSGAAAVRALARAVLECGPHTPNTLFFCDDLLGLGV